MYSACACLARSRCLPLSPAPGTLPPHALPSRLSPPATLTAEASPS